MQSVAQSNLSVDAAKARWVCPRDWLGFETSNELDLSHPRPLPERVESALRFALQAKAPDQHVFIAGLEGSGRRQAFRQVYDSLSLPRRKRLDHCYVHHFIQPDRPALLSFEAGGAVRFSQMMQRLQTQVEALPSAMQADPFESILQRAKQEQEAKVSEFLIPIEAKLAQQSLALVPVKSGEQVRLLLLPLVEGQPTPPESLAQLLKGGKVSKEVHEALVSALNEHQSTAEQVQSELAKLNEQGMAHLQTLSQRACHDYLQQATQPIRAGFSQADVGAYLDALVDDVLEHLPALMKGQLHVSQRYGVNIVQRCDSTEQAPVVYERSASAASLLGSLEPVVSEQAQGAMVMDYRSIRAGSLLQADGGYLVVDADDLMREPSGYAALIHALRTGQLDQAAATGRLPSPASLKPEPIPLSVKVVLVGSGRSFYQLSGADRAFSRLFKVFVDIDHSLPRNRDTALIYSLYLAKRVDAEGLLHLHAEAVAALLEHGARVAAAADKVTANLARIMDLAREANYLASEAGKSVVTAAEVNEAVRRTKWRAGQPTQRFAESLERGAMIIKTRGAVVGQINGLAVMQSGLLSYGFPARITTSVGVGRAGLIDIEGQAEMSGSIHTKGFHILGGLLRELLQSQHPLAFSASIAFEQSYGGIDGDSASGAEMCCLLSALTGVPVRQDRAMTGAIDQKGHLQVIGGVNEKIEGFFDACRVQGLNAQQGVVIPKPNAGDLMLRQDVVEAIDDGRFAVYAVGTIQEAIGLMLSVAGESNPTAAAASVIKQARQKAHEYYRLSLGQGE